MNQSCSVSKIPGEPLVAELLEFVSARSLLATFAGTQEHCGRRGRGDEEVAVPDNLHRLLGARSIRGWHLEAVEVWAVEHGWELQIQEGNVWSTTGECDS